MAEKTSGGAYSKCKKIGKKLDTNAIIKYEEHIYW
jgi:hypothetical protein